MPEPSYSPPFLMKNGHVQTIFPSLFRRIDGVCYKRERIRTADDDFLDLDWSTQNHSKLAILSHGLEGCSSRSYIKGMARALNDNGWDALAWNYRSCSGEPNHQLRSYHNGVTDDLAWVIDHAGKKRPYQQIALIGFSLGGNLTLLHIGRETPNPMISKAVVFSVPCDLASSAQTLAKPANVLYMKRFLKMLHQKVREKKQLMPERIDDTGFDQIKNFKDFDDRYTAPIHGFTDARDYWTKCSSKPFIPDIRIPTLIVNAVNDPFLPEACYPFKEAESNQHITLLTPESGGHVGFVCFNRQNLYWSEKTAVRFLNQD